MKRVCAYCNSIMSPGSSPDAPVTHGICTSCSDQLFSELGTDISRYIDMFDAPVILVNQDARVLGANCGAVGFLSKPLDQIHNSLAGDVLGCKNAGLPGGCGNTDFCSRCIIRNCVRKTYESGKPVDRSPAVLMQGTDEQSQPITLHISTEKAGSVILLRIEPVGAGRNPPGV